MRLPFQSLVLAAGVSAGVALCLTTSTAAAQAPAAAPPAADQPPVRSVTPPARREDRIDYASPPIRPAPVAPNPPLPSFITNPSWSRTPRPEFPAAAIAANVENGRATLSCIVTPTGALTDCSVVAETPADLGFGEAAVAAARRARVSPGTVDGAAVGARVNFTVVYQLAPEEAAPAPPASGSPAISLIQPALPAGEAAPPFRRPSEITPSTWVRGPEPEYPLQARAAGIREGRVEMKCEVSTDGELTACSAAEETPPGHGFGAAAVAAAMKARVTPRLIDGAAVSSQLRFAIHFRAP